MISMLPLFGCQKSNQSTTQIDNKSYIKDFELFQNNANGESSLRISSPKAIIDPITNDIEIFENSIELLNNNSQDFKVLSGNASLINSTNTIKAFNNVKISFLNKSDYYVNTNSLDWDLNSSLININNSVNINFDNTKINASKGLYNTDLSSLKLYKSEFTRNIFNSEGDNQYQVKIKSDFVKWFKKDNTLVFSSNNKQVEATINLLLTK